MKKEEKVLQAKDREIYALKHQVSSKDKQIKEKKADISILEAKVQAASMFIAYLSQRFPQNSDGEVVIDQKDLYEFASGYETSWMKDDKANTITIKTIKK